MNNELTITVSRKTIIDLVRIYTTTEQLEDTLRTIVGNTTFEGYMEDLARIYGVLSSLTPLYDCSKDFQDTDFNNLMESDILSRVELKFFPTSSLLQINF